MDARSIAVQHAILSFLKKNGVQTLKDKKRGNIVTMHAPGQRAVEVQISVREMATYVADKMKPE